MGLDLKVTKCPISCQEENSSAWSSDVPADDPDILLADEPTGNLDPETSEGIIRLLRDISSTGRAVMIATHNYTILKKFPARTTNARTENVRGKG